jgi:hypothetical protein
MKRGRRSPGEALLRPIHDAHSSDHTILVHMPARLFVEFHRTAEHLEMSVSALAGKLLAAITTSNIYNAVLDDKD